MKNYIQMILFLFCLSAVSAGILTAFNLETKGWIEKNKKRERFIHILKSMRILPDSVRESIAHDSKYKNLPENSDKEKFQKEALYIERMEYYLKKENIESLMKVFEQYLDVLEIQSNGRLTLYSGQQFLLLPSEKIDYIHNLYIFRGKSQGSFVYTFEIAGSGFWDRVAGYLTLKEGLVEIAGISFYDHKETPGLGQRIEEGWFQAQFTFWNKRIWKEDNKELVLHVTRRQGTYDGECTAAFGKSDNEVDAITGASETSRALDRFISQNLHFVFSQFTRVIESEVSHFFDPTSLAFLKKFRELRP